MRFISRYVSNTFLFGVLLTCVAYTSISLDPCLALRFLIFALVLFTAFLIVQEKDVRFKIPLNPVTISYSAYVLISLVSVSWALNLSEAIFSAARDLLGYLAFLLTLHILKK